MVFQSGKTLLTISSRRNISDIAGFALHAENPSIHHFPEELLSCPPNRIDVAHRDLTFPVGDICRFLISFNQCHRFTSCTSFDSKSFIRCSETGSLYRFEVFDICNGPDSLLRRFPHCFHFHIPGDLPRVHLIEKMENPHPF